MAKKTPEQVTLVMLRPTRVDGKSVAVGEKVVTTRRVGVDLVGMGKAREVEAAKGKKADAAPAKGGKGGQLTTEDAAPLTRSTKAEG